MSYYMIGPYIFVYNYNVYYFTVGFFITITDHFFSCIVLLARVQFKHWSKIKNAFLTGSFRQLSLVDIL